MKKKVTKTKPAVKKEDYIFYEKHNANKWEDWLECWNTSEKLRNQIKKMTDEQKKEAFASHRLNFGTAGIRAIMGPGTQMLNKFVYHQMAYGYAKYVLSKNRKAKVIIGHDNRALSDEFAIECAKIMSMLGVEAFIYTKNKLMPTPIISYTIRKMGFDGGINITASHNPKEYNGFKAYNKLGAQILPEDAKIIVDNMPESKDILNIESNLIDMGKKPRIQTVDYDKITSGYFKEVARAVNIDPWFREENTPIKNTPIVFTGFQGTTTELMPKFLKFLGFKKIVTVPGQNQIAPDFSASPIANPEDYKAFYPAIKEANARKASIIVGCDPDGDRMTIGFKKTNRWRFLNGNELGVILAYYILGHKKFKRRPYILTTHVSTSYVDRIAKDFGAKVIRTQTGFKWMCNLIDTFEQKGEMAIAFEEAIGSLVHTCCRDKDSFGSTALALEVANHISEYYVDLHEYLQDQMFEQYGDTHSATISLTLDSKDWTKDAKILMDRALKVKKSLNLYDYKIQKIWFNPDADAVEWILDKNSWIKFRISGTEPKFKIYFCLNDQLVGQLRTSAVENLRLIMTNVLKDIKFK